MTGKDQTSIALPALLLVLTAALDAASTLWAVAIFGIEVEFNPIIRRLLYLHPLLIIPYKAILMSVLIAILYCWRTDPVIRSAAYGCSVFTALVFAHNVAQIVAFS